MSRAELDAAGITDTSLRQAYLHCRAINAQHGRTYFLATRLLARHQRPAVHALYGFARWADDIVDVIRESESIDQRGWRLKAFADSFFTGVSAGHSSDPLLSAVVDTVRRYRLQVRLFQDFLRSMRMDLTVTEYPTRTALQEYVRGSAEAIGLQMLPVLGTTRPAEEAAPYAAGLGNAFQMTNFLRDVAEDLRMGRIYLPLDELSAFDVDRALLAWCCRRERTDRRVRNALIDQIARTRCTYDFARPGLAMLDPVSQPCVRTAFHLYSEILDRIEDEDYAVFSRRARVGKLRRLRVASPALFRALLARRAAEKARYTQESQCTKDDSRVADSDE